MVKALFLHICKTGGTALKYLSQRDQGRLDFAISRHHRTTLMNSGDVRVVFGVRDPWQRFCSGYWERATMHQRRDYYNQHMRAKNVASFGYSELKPPELKILDQFTTPDALITHWRTNNIQWGHRDLSVPFWEVICPITRWIGDLETFQANENRVHVVYEVGDMSAVFQRLYGVAMPEDPFRKRSRGLFDIEQSYETSQENLDWFRTVFRPEDYRVIDYVRSRPYYQCDRS